MRVLIDSWLIVFRRSSAVHQCGTRSKHAIPRSADVILVLGGYLPNPGTTKVIQITTEADEINKAHSVELPMLADTRLRCVTSSRQSRACQPKSEWLLWQAAYRGDTRIQPVDAGVSSRRSEGELGNAPISWQRLAMELDGALDPDALIIDELSTEKSKLFSYVRTSDNGRLRIGRSQQQALAGESGYQSGQSLQGRTGKWFL